MKYLFRLIYIPWDGLAFTSEEAYYWHEAVAARRGYLNKAPNDKVFICIDGDSSVTYLGKALDALMEMSDYSV